MDDVGIRRVALEETLEDHEYGYGTKMRLVHMTTDLFTFWPPGPEDLLKLTSHTAFSRIVSASRFASHLRAASISSSSAAPLSFRVANCLDTVIRGLCRSGLTLLDGAT